MSHLEDTLWNQIHLAKLPVPEREYQAIPGRRFRWDFAWPTEQDGALLVEVQGGTWNTGAHGRGSGISRDCEKLNLATLNGWKILQFTSDQIRDGKALACLQWYFRQREAA